MAKYYEVKVYNQEGGYLTTWKDVVSDIQFNNEINSAGGQLKLLLARDAGDYGEGTDVSFGYKVIVYCFDNEEPNGQSIFQGYISAYNPIYKDDKIEVTILGFGAELNDYIVEAGDTAYVSQLVNNKTYNIGSQSPPGYIYTVMQTFILAADKTISSVDIMASGSAGLNTFTVYIKERVGATPDINTDPDLAYGSASYSGAFSAQVLKVNFTETVALVSTKNYYIQIYGNNSTTFNSYGLVKVHATSTNPYASGQVYTDIFAGTSWIGATSVAADDLYFVIYEYGGNTTAVYTAQDPTTILSNFLIDYQSRGGLLTEPLSSLEPLINQPTKSITTSLGTWSTAHAQIFTPASTIVIDTIQVFAKGDGYEPIYIYRGDPSLDTLTVISGSTSYDLGVGNTLVATSDGTDFVNTDLEYTAFRFATSVTLTAGVSYYFVYWAGGSISGDTVQFRSAGAGDIISSPQVGNLYRAENNTNNTGTAMAFTTTYRALYFDLLYLPDGVPADANGGYVPTETLVDYTFNVQTLLEAINILKNISPENWYWYINQSTNELKFKEKSDEPEHIFSLEKDIIDAKFEKRTEDIVNTLYFTGGDTGAGVNFYKKYIDANSIQEYGVKSVKYSDTRVTTSATADLIGNNIIATRSQPELRVNLTILDSNNNQELGYDIESLQVGDVIAVRNITQQVGLSSWDVGRWDEAYWDFNIYNLSSLRMQIQKIDYNEDTATVYASTIAIDVNKRVEQINRNLEALQVTNNPIAPS